MGDDQDADKPDDQRRPAVDADPLPEDHDRQQGREQWRREADRRRRAELIEKSGSHMTHRWRKPDSNPRSRFTSSPFLRAADPPSGAGWSSLLTPRLSTVDFAYKEADDSSQGARMAAIGKARSRTYPTMIVVDPACGQRSVRIQK